MLGVRLDDVMESQLERVAREQGRSKSAVVRHAIRSYLDRTDTVFRAEVERQCQLAAAEWTVDDDEWEALAAAWDDEDPVADAAA